MKAKLIKREPYSDFLKETIGGQHIKIITGVRRAGKSTLLSMLVNDLKESGILEDQIVQLNFEL